MSDSFLMRLSKGIIQGNPVYGIPHPKGRMASIFDGFAKNIWRAPMMFGKLLLFTLAVSAVFLTTVIALYLGFFVLFFIITPISALRGNFQWADESMDEPMKGQ